MFAGQVLNFPCRHIVEIPYVTSEDALVVESVRVTSVHYVENFRSVGQIVD